MSNLELAAVELNRARLEVDRKRAALSEARKTLNARHEQLERCVRASRRRAAA